MPVTVVICTRDRGGAVCPGVASILSQGDDKLELLVVDQSSSNATEAALEAFSGDSRLRVIRSHESGLSRARNLAFQCAANELIGVTDDDCVPEKDWLEKLKLAMVDPAVGIVFGGVVAAPHDPTREFVTTYLPRRRFTARTVHQKYLVEGIGANFACRRSLWKCLHGFDTSLGVGGRFGSASETDLAVRSLLAGRAVAQVPEFRVIHHGFRPVERSAEVVRRYLRGVGAMYAKHLRLGNGVVLAQLIPLAVRWALSGGGPVGIGNRANRRDKLLGFIDGFTKGLRFPLDLERGVFID